MSHCDLPVFFVYIKNIMKRNSILLLLSIILLVGCKQQLPPFSTTQMVGKNCFMVKTDDPYLPEPLNPYGVENSFSLVWPGKGMMTKEAEKELIMQVFNDSISTTAKDAAKLWLKNSWNYDETTKVISTKKVDSVSNLETYTYSHLENSIREDNNLVTFINTNEASLAGAAHGMYIVGYLTYDRKAEKVVHLNDLVDTSKLGEVIVRAIQDLDVNKEVRECLFDEFKTAEKIFVPDNFDIDSTRSTINLTYQQYDITPYACGLQTVVLPIYWLSKHLELTPYAKELFGKGSYIEE